MGLLDFLPFANSGIQADQQPQVPPGLLSGLFGSQPPAGFLTNPPVQEGRSVGAPDFTAGMRGLSDGDYLQPAQPSGNPMQLPSANGGGAPTVDASGFDLSKLGDVLGGLYGRGGPGDPLIALSAGILSKRGLGPGLAAGLENAQRQQLVNQQTALTGQKAQAAQAQLQGRVSYLQQKFPQMSQAELLATATNDPIFQEVYKRANPSEQFAPVLGSDGKTPLGQRNLQTGKVEAYPQERETKPHWFTGADGKTYASDPADPTKPAVLVPNQPDKTFVPLTDPSQRAKYGISPDDNQPYRLDPTTNKVEAVGGGGVKVYNGQQEDYTAALTKGLATSHQNLAQGVEGSQARMRDISAMQGALQRIQQAGGTTGFGREEITQLQSAVNTGARALGMNEPFDVTDPQLMTKFNRTLAGAQAKDVGGARVTNFEMSNFLKANAGLALTPEANQRLLGIQAQIEQRNIDLGNHVRELTAQSISNNRKVDPAAVEKLIRDYDEAHHITDPITGQDLTKNLVLPNMKPQAGTGAAVQSPKALPSWQRIGE